MPTFISSQRQASCSATMWHAQPQNQRPSSAVDRIASAKNTAPAFRSPRFENSMASEGSSGDSVCRVRHQWTMWTAIATWTAIRTSARHFPARERRTTGSGPDAPRSTSCSIAV
jgi:hypothetical protein